MTNKNQVSILQAPDLILRTKSGEVADFEDAEKIIKWLIEVTMRVDRPWKLWLGMAAPQIGFNKRIFIVKKSYQQYDVFVNPEIVQKKWRLPIIGRCYSLRGVYFVWSYLWCKIKYQDIKGQQHRIVMCGGRAAALCHELDHIDGIIISDRGRRLI